MVRAILNSVGPAAETTAIHKSRISSSIIGPRSGMWIWPKTEMMSYQRHLVAKISRATYVRQFLDKKLFIRRPVPCKVMTAVSASLASDCVKISGGRRESRLARRRPFLPAGGLADSPVSKPPARAARGRLRGIHGGRATPNLPAETRTL